MKRNQIERKPPPRKPAAANSGRPRDAPHQAMRNERKKEKKERTIYVFGNYDRYYSYRCPSDDDPRIPLLRPEWFTGKDVLDIGCNTGRVTIPIAYYHHVRTMVGTDIDSGLISRAYKLLRWWIRDPLPVPKYFLKGADGMPVAPNPVPCVIVPGSAARPKPSPPHTKGTPSTGTPPSGPAPLPVPSATPPFPISNGHSVPSITPEARALAAAPTPAAATPAASTGPSEALQPALAPTSTPVPAPLAPAEAAPPPAPAEVPPPHPLHPAPLPSATPPVPGLFALPPPPPRKRAPAPEPSDEDGEGSDKERSEKKKRARSGAAASSEDDEGEDEDDEDASHASMSEEEEGDEGGAGPVGDDESVVSQEGVVFQPFPAALGPPLPASFPRALVPGLWPKNMFFALQDPTRNPILGTPRLGPAASPALFAPPGTPTDRATARMDLVISPSPQPPISMRAHPAGPQPQNPAAPPPAGSVDHPVTQPATAPAPATGAPSAMGVGAGTPAASPPVTPAPTATSTGGAAPVPTARAAVGPLRTAPDGARGFFPYGLPSIFSHPAGHYDTVMCLSVTKWVHLNYGDEGVKALFRRVDEVLKPGGIFILEPQPWRSYKRKCRLTPALRATHAAIRLFPETFIAYLRDAHHFEILESIHPERAQSKGFKRPIYIFRKDWRDPDFQEPPARAGKGIFRFLRRPVYIRSISTGQNLRIRRSGVVDGMGGWGRASIFEILPSGQPGVYYLTNANGFYLRMTPDGTLDGRGRGGSLSRFRLIPQGGNLVSFESTRIEGAHVGVLPSGEAKNGMRTGLGRHGQFRLIPR
ncbi:putative 7SK snRNA methylphosphate capping enzyme [Paratrimastix pyriformis]|uniref:RNA methyltransferase n=1 Tax=Paratrimastix pyriformis TaxID=342808 RepID=A0ABQ8US94_9EUKA|nr:putative 7SK snRNA methylphosphate capping enzyme [Paratrimastix pyriformis]